MKYIKKFEAHTDYERYRNSQDYTAPNVSYCVDQDEVHFDEYTPVDTRIFATINVTSTSSDTYIIGYHYRYGCMASSFSEIEIDDVVQNEFTCRYRFKTTGEHTIKYTSVDSTSIGNYVFNNCTGLTSVTISSSVTSIGEESFNDCTGLTSVTIPSSVTSIGSNAFNHCTGLTSINVNSNNTIYDSRDNCNAIIHTATNTLLFGCKNTVIPSSVTSIENGAFNTITGLTSITIPSSVTSIGEYAFSYCTGLTSVTISSGVTSIGKAVFTGCTGLTSITIPSSVTSIGNYAFSNCSGLTSVTCEATTPPTLGSGTFGSTNNCPIYVPAESVSAYKAATNWSTYASRIQAIPTT